MTRLEIIKLQMEYKAEEIANRKGEVERYAKYALEDTQRGHYSMAAQYGEKIAAAGHRLDATIKEHADFSEMIRLLEKEEREAE